MMPPFNNTYKPPCVCDGCVVPKGWGEELIIENNELYVGKIFEVSTTHRNEDSFRIWKGDSQ